MRRAWPLLLPVLVALGGWASTGCTPRYPECRTDEHCQRVNPREVCVNNRCVQCRDDSQCDPGYECNNNTCERIEGWCNDASECPPGQICRDNRCQPCVTNEDCGYGYRCVDGRCVEGECGSDADCPAGQTCVDGRCQAPAVAQEMGCSYEPVYFDFDRSNIRADQRDALQATANCVRERSPEALNVEGNCDPRGTTEYNYALGEQRARSVKRYLTNLGVRGNVLRTVSYGEDRATGTSESSWSQDRRVDINQ